MTCKITTELCPHSPAQVPTYYKKVKDVTEQCMLFVPGFQQIGEFPWSSYKELNRGLLLDFSFLSAPQVAHNLQYEAAWRHLTCLDRSSAFAVREQCGHTLKSALRHILCVDRRDNPVFPSEGSLFKLVQEYAGLGGDIGFFKNEIETQINVPMPSFPNVIFQVQTQRLSKKCIYSNMVSRVHFMLDTFEGPHLETRV